MKRFTVISLLCLVAVSAVAQQKADIIVSYDVRSKDWVTDSLRTHHMTLLANAAGSKFFNDISLWTDSLKSTPEGKEQWSQIIMAACMTRTPDGGMAFDMRKGPVKKEHTYVFTSLPEENLTLYDVFAGDPGYYREPLAEMQWQIADTTASILGYECVGARTDYHGRIWTAWFAPELPVPFGPWKLHGLPGLILKAESDNGITYKATGIQHTDRIMTPMYSAGDYGRVDRRKALADDDHYLNNKEAMLRARFAGSVRVTTPSSSEKYDGRRYASEPDYLSD